MNSRSKLEVCSVNEAADTHAIHCAGVVPRRRLYTIVHCLKRVLDSTDSQIKSSHSVAAIGTYFRFHVTTRAASFWTDCNSRRCTDFNNVQIVIAVVKSDVINTCTSSLKSRRSMNSNQSQLVAATAGHSLLSGAAPPIAVQSRITSRQVIFGRDRLPSPSRRILSDLTLVRCSLALSTINCVSPVFNLRRFDHINGSMASMHETTRGRIKDFFSPWSEDMVLSRQYMSENWFMHLDDRCYVRRVVQERNRTEEPALENTTRHQRRFACLIFGSDDMRSLADDGTDARQRRSSYIERHTYILTSTEI